MRYRFDLESALVSASIGFLVMFFAVGMMFGWTDRYQYEKLRDFYGSGDEPPISPNATSMMIGFELYG
ncbi:MAG: hypothetical protein JSV05_09405 [Candidatus Bathyarchaeota archaeon]|nr:MAG: hypothetical protein JSV05_09405 [Candidatus Bathyarchaeota archaeon]